MIDKVRLECGSDHTAKLVEGPVVNGHRVKKILPEWIGATIRLDGEDVTYKVRSRPHGMPDDVFFVEGLWDKWKGTRMAEVEFEDTRRGTPADDNIRRLKGVV